MDREHSALRAERRSGRRIDAPQPGYFLRRYVRGGYQVPCRIIRHPDGQWQAEEDGVLLEPAHRDPHHAIGVMAIWQGAVETTEAEYLHRSALREWARQYDPRHPCLRPYETIDISSAPPLF